MIMRVYDTLHGEVVPFEPLDKTRVGIYVCGPTVYDSPHIGHARTYIAFDMIVRYLIHKGYRVKYVVNITDIDDKIIKRADESGVPPMDLARRFEEIFLEDMESLNLKKPDVYPRVSDHIPEIIEMIQVLIRKGYAYQVDGNVYFDVTLSPGLGKLSHQSLDELLAGARVEVDERKRNPGDFALWKSSKEGEPFWESPFGRGRPGWHIECSAMSIKYLGEQFEIHGGAMDLIFPHHENEIAQSEAFTGRSPVVKYWLHTGFLTIGGEKMSKSLGNFITIRELLEKFDANTFRLFVVSTHYRSPIDYSEKALKQASKSLNRIFDTLDNLRQGILTGKKEQEREEEKRVGASTQAIGRRFLEAMDNDFNTPKAAAEFFRLIRLGNRASTSSVDVSVLKSVYDLIVEFGGIFGLELERRHELTEEERRLIEERNIARKNMDWEKADEIRERLKKKGIILKDYSTGTLWTVERKRKT